MYVDFYTESNIPSSLSSVSPTLSSLLKSNKFKQVAERIAGAEMAQHFDHYLNRSLSDSDWTTFEFKVGSVNVAHVAKSKELLDGMYAQVAQ